MSSFVVPEKNQDATIYVGNLDDLVTDAIVWELFVQAGPVLKVHMPKDRITQKHQGYAFVEFVSEDDAEYAIKIMNMIKLFGKPIRVNKASADRKNLDVGANVFIGNLATEVDEKMLYDTFSAFGVILQTPTIMRDHESGVSKGYAFINFASFEASDAAIDAMNGQHFCNRPISLDYAFKKDSRGQRHGTEAERLLAAQNPLLAKDRPHQLFADSNSLGKAANGATGPRPTATEGGSYPPTQLQQMPPPPPPPFVGGQEGMPYMGHYGMVGGFPPPPPPPGFPMPHQGTGISHPQRARGMPRMPPPPPPPQV
eukprot:Nk52_evm12s1762 gene=Nk52_evmTU12s1762